MQERRLAESCGANNLKFQYFSFLDIPVTVVMPVVAPIMKVENCKKFGAKVIIHGDNIGESRERALEIGKENGLMYVNG